MRMRAGWRVAAAGTFAAALTLACGVPVDSTAVTVDDEVVPYELLSPTTTAQVGTSNGRETTICLVVDGVLLSLGRDRDDGALDSDLALVTDSPTEGEAALGVRSALDGEDSVLGVERVGPGAVVELGEDFAELPADQQLLAVAQITCTLTAQPGVQEVNFVLDDRELEVPVQGGELVDRPVSRTDYLEFFAN